MDAKATISAILALQKRADHYGSDTKCGYAAAAEKLQEAFFMAQRLPGLPEDNLVALYVQAERCRFLISQALRTNNLAGGDTEASRGFVAAATSSLLPVIAALLRRMDAGTLQPGRCAPLEEAWFVRYITDMRELMLEHGIVVTVPPPAQYGPLVGLAAMYDAAVEALEQRMLGLVSVVPHPEALTLVVRALDLLIKPRPLEDTLLMPEMIFVRSMLSFQKHDTILQYQAASHPARAAQVQQLSDAWARVQASGVLQRRDLHIAGKDMTSEREENRHHREAADARQEKRGLRSCGLASCGAKEAHVSHFKGCGACKTVFYCCREHQLEDWPAHKAACKAARKAAAADDKQ